MNISTSPEFRPRGTFSPGGLLFIVVLHVLVGYALVSGLAHKTLVLAPKPVTVALIDEVKLAPPPPPLPPPPAQKPPEPVVKQEIRQVQPTPAAFVPTPELVSDQAPPPTAITHVQSVLPAAPTPVAESPAPTKAAATDIVAVCPKQVRPTPPRKALDEGISGVVTAEARIRAGKVVEVRILSGPRVYHNAVRTAMALYECDNTSGADLLATQDFNFKVE